ncbi:MAG TPA: DUF4253 domain-containing protein [Nitrospirota bacterium]|nr:DUF4253 domain-containing protein [Nitrospirota bacterium]
MEQKKPPPLVIIKPQKKVLTPEQRQALAFPADLIAQMELAAGGEAEPFYRTVIMQTENLRGEKDIETRKLAGFSVHVKSGDDLIASKRGPLRARGYLIFKSHRGIGKVPDTVTVIKGRNSYDILSVQGTEATNYHLDTAAIIAWLKARKQDGTFVVTGAGAEWVEARFVKPPAHMAAFAKMVAAFAPDVIRSNETIDDLVERMEKEKGFTLVWD